MSARPSRFAAFVAALGLALALAACRSTAPPAPAGPITEASRLRAVRDAEVWHPVDTAALDVRAGPPGSRDPGVALECSFVVPHSRISGNAPRFRCRLASGEVILVKYGRGNGEVHGAIFGSRLLWLLGFYGDRVDVVRVSCRGCPEDPWGYLQGIDPSEPRPPPPADPLREIAPAVVETRLGHAIETRPGQGLSWPDLLSERSGDPTRARTQRVRREALALLAAFVGQDDGRGGRQTLACHPEDGEPSRCTRPVAYLGDLGSILGHDSGVAASKAALEAWAKRPIWRDAAGCIANLRARRQTTPFDPAISEPARAFLAERLAAVSEAQARDLFTVAGLDGVDDWVAVFDARRRAIAEARCPDRAPGP